MARTPDQPPDQHPKTPPCPPPCPLCGKPPVAAFAPFCSAGCRDRDLLAWLDGGYIVAGRPAFDDEDG